MAFPDPSFNGLVGLFGYANIVTDNLFCAISLMALWLIVFLWLLNRNYDPSECATTAGFLTVFPAVFYRVSTYAGEPLITDSVMFLAVLALLVPAIWMYFQNK